MITLKRGGTHVAKTDHYSRRHGYRWVFRDKAVKE